MQQSLWESLYIICQRMRLLCEVAIFCIIYIRSLFSSNRSLIPFPLLSLYHLSSLSYPSPFSLLSLLPPLPPSLSTVPSLFPSSLLLSPSPLLDSILIYYLRYLQYKAAVLLEHCDAHWWPSCWLQHASSPIFTSHGVKSIILTGQTSFKLR